jgi:hypothetical protein
LERVAADNRFIDKADDSPFSILPDYTVPGLDHEVLTTILAGVIGVLIVAGVGAGVARSASHGGKGSLES